jgi:pimeloyl-ACP methyl ester carboxylesterase
LVLFAGYAVLSFDLYDRGSSRLDDRHEHHTADLFVQQLQELWDKVIVEHDDHAEEQTEKNKEKDEGSRDSILPPLRKDSFALVGHSMGGAVSLLFAHHRPNLVPHLLPPAVAR